MIDMCICRILHLNMKPVLWIYIFNYNVNSALWFVQLCHSKYVFKIGWHGGAMVGTVSPHDEQILHKRSFRCLKLKRDEEVGNASQDIKVSQQNLESVDYLNSDLSPTAQLHEHQAVFWYLSFVTFIKVFCFYQCVLQCLPLVPGCCFLLTVHFMGKPLKPTTLFKEHNMTLGAKNPYANSHDPYLKRCPLKDW